MARSGAPGPACMLGIPVEPLILSVVIAGQLSGEAAITGIDHVEV